VADQGQATVGESLDGLTAEIRALARILGTVLSNQSVTADLVAQVLQKVSRKSDGDPLGELLSRLLVASDRHTEQLDTIMGRVSVK
jgi:hypothetical protein